MNSSVTPAEHEVVMETETILTLWINRSTPSSRGRTLGIHAR